MSRWWRAYDEAVDDPKLLLLTDKQHRGWFNIMCIASIYGGTLPDLPVLAVKLRSTPAKVRALLDDLKAAGLLDETDGNLTPHNWNGRQYKSDVSTERVKRFRETKRNVSVTPPENREQNTESKKPEADASGPPAIATPRDIRADLFGKGLQTLASITGKTPDSCRSLVGKWLKSVNDEAIHVLGAIEDAERNRVADPVAWINRTLQPRTRDGQRQSVIASADRLVENFGLFERSDGTELLAEVRGGEGAAAVRMLPAK